LRAENPGDSTRIVALDSFRGIFAIMIVFLHSNFEGTLFYSPFIRHSYIFVDFFFVLSGFVISMTYLDRIKEPKSLFDFFARRLGRLWPLSAAMAIAMFSLTVAKYTVAHAGFYSANPSHSLTAEFRQLIKDLFLCQSFENREILWLDFPSWSISAEVFAYILFGLLCLLGALFFPAAILVFAISWIAAQSFINPGFGHAFTNGLYRAICYFFLGNFCYLLWRRNSDTPLPYASAIEIALIALIIFQVYYLSAFTSTIQLTFAAAIYVFASQSGVVSRIFSIKPFQRVGTLSYSIYLIHIPIFAVSALLMGVGEKKLGLALHHTDPVHPDHIMVNFGSPALMDALTLAHVAVVVLVAQYTYRLIERPAQKTISILLTTGPASGRSDDARTGSHLPEIDRPHTGKDG